MNNKSKQIMTSRNIKTLLFASLIAAMILPFSTMNYAVAEELDKEKVEKIAKKAQKLMEKLETEDNPKKIKKIQKKLDKLLVKLNSVGLYTEKQFEVIKEERLDDYPDEISSQAKAYCSSCNDPSVKVKVGFDYRLWGFYGTANGNWDTITNADKNGFSVARTGSWGADYIHTWYQYYLANGANGANVNLTPYLTNSNGGHLHEYGTFQPTVISTSIQQDYPSTIAYSPINGGDKANMVATLQSIW